MIPCVWGRGCLGTLLALSLWLPSVPARAQAPAAPNPVTQLLATMKEVRRETGRIRDQGARERKAHAEEMARLRQAAAEAQHRMEAVERRAQGAETGVRWLTGLGVALLALTVLALLSAGRAREMNAQLAMPPALRQPLSDLDARLQALERELNAS